MQLGLSGGFGVGPRRKQAQVISYGGGVDSFCMLLDALDRGERPDALVFADVGDPQRKDPAEWPDTYRHLRDVVVPFARKHRIPFYWLSTGPGLTIPGATVQIYPIRPGSMATRSGAAYMRWGARTGGVQVPTTKSRSCTAAFKVERYQKWLADNMPDTDVVTWIGYDASEGHRVQRKTEKGDDPYGAKVTPGMAAAGVAHRARYPLMDLELTPAQRARYYGDPKRLKLLETYRGKTGLDRAACKALIREHGLEVPRKSACVFCPFTKDHELIELLRLDPDVFAWVEAWERDRRTIPTSFNVIMGMFGFQTFALSPARHRVMLKIQRREQLDSRELRETLPWLIDHNWVGPFGNELTLEGVAIAAAGGTRPVTKDSGAPVRKAAGKNMILGVHYTSPTMREFLQGKYPEAFACQAIDEELALHGNLAGVQIIHPSSLLRRARGRKMAA
jgi:hypothetical protein